MHKRFGFRYRLIVGAAVFLGGIIIWQNDGAGVPGKQVADSNATAAAAQTSTGDTTKEEENTNKTENTEKAENPSKTEEAEKKDYIKWVEFNVTAESLNQAYTYDVDTYGSEVHLNWIELLAYLGAKYGGDFTSYKASDMSETAERLMAGETTMEELSAGMQYYKYYCEAYTAVLGGMIGEYEIQCSAGQKSDGANEDENDDENGSANAGGGESEIESKSWKKYYGLKSFSPIAKTFPYSDYDDFGVSRSYGYRRNHLGHDMMGQVGTPVISMETGYITALGWNQYGGWRIGISSFDKKRYYYYAHLRQNIPFAKGLEVGDVVQAGDVIGYMGRTGYSTTENVNNIDTYHLHVGLQLIFDESQREGNNEIWVDIYPLIQFLSKNRSDVLRNDADKEWYRKYEMKDPAAEVFLKTNDGEIKENKEIKDKKTE